MIVSVPVEIRCSNTFVRIAIADLHETCRHPEATYIGTICVKILMPTSTWQGLGSTGKSEVAEGFIRMAVVEASEGFSDSEFEETDRRGQKPGAGDVGTADVADELQPGSEPANPHLRRRWGQRGAQLQTTAQVVVMVLMRPSGRMSQILRW